jgi:hypothetical protein
VGNAIRRGFVVSVALAMLAGISPPVASATTTTTFYVASTGSDAGNSCTVAATPCLTIQHAAAASETTPGLGLIDVAPGTYVATVNLTNLSDFGLTIAGTGATARVTLGRFTHADVAGTNTFVFTGRVGGKPLRAGSYQLKGVPINANGAGAAVVKGFTISE